MITTRWNKPPRDLEARSLATRYPDIAAEWMRFENALPAHRVLAGSHLRGRWRCSVCGNRFWLGIVERVRIAPGCPACRLPRMPGTSRAEIRLACELASFLPVDVGCHVVQGATRTWQVDVVCSRLGLLVEYDGSRWHAPAHVAARDLHKTVDLEGAGWLVLRVRERPLPVIRDHDVVVSRKGGWLTGAKHVAVVLDGVPPRVVRACARYAADPAPWAAAEADAAIRAAFTV